MDESGLIKLVETVKSLINSIDERFESGHVGNVSYIGSAGQVSCGDTPGPEVNVSGTRGSFFSTGLTGTDYNFAKFETGGGKVKLADFIYLNLVL